MWHVDEGALHAYLDGALDEYPPAEARRVRDHVETCAVCGDRLADERRVREEAQDILGLAAPQIEVPTFEELKAYVRASTPATSAISIRLYRLGWAASVVLALGTGWMLRGRQAGPMLAPRPAELAQDRTLTDSPAPEQERSSVVESGGAPLDAPVPSSPALAERRLEVAMEPSAVGARSEATAELTAQPGAGRTVSKAADDVAADLAVSPPPSGAVARALSDASAGPAAGVTVAPELLPLAPTRLDRARESDALASRQTAANEVTQDSDVRGAEAARRAAPEQRLTSAITSEPAAVPGALGRSATAEPPTDEETVSLVVPGLDVLDVLPVGLGTTFAGMRAIQRLETGDTLELVHLPDGVEPSSLPPLRQGWHELVRRRGSGWLVMRAPLPETSLAELLQRLEVGR